MQEDLRFCSHHEMMRAIELAAVRAELPLAYSQGFNPHPLMSLVCPRPVGVASREELLILGLESAPPDEQAPSETAERLVAALQGQAPRGLRFLRAEVLTGKAKPRPIRIDYVLPLDDEQLSQVRQRLERLGRSDAWPVERLASVRGRRGAMETRTIDIKPMIRQLTCRDGELAWSAVPSGGTWARPSDVLRLLGLDERVALARVIRIAVQCDSRNDRACPDSNGEGGGAEGLANQDNQKR